MQEVRRFKPSTVSRRFSVAAGFYRTCVIDGTTEHWEPTSDKVRAEIGPRKADGPVRFSAPCDEAASRAVSADRFHFSSSLSTDVWSSTSEKT